MSTEIAPRTPSSRVPTTNSVEPPPMSTTRYGGSASAGRPRTAPVNDRRASSSPVTTSGGTPSVRSTMARKSAALEASREAEVAHMRTRSAPDFSISAA